MWDEEINKKIKDAADQYHPAYDDSAWNKMEQMLDEHLPRKKDRRRIIYFLPIIVLLTGILFFMISRKETIPFAKNSEKTLLKSTPVKSQNESTKTSPGKDEIASVPAPAKPANGLVADVKVKNGLIKQPSLNANPVIKKVYSLSTRKNVAISSKNTPPASENLALNYNEQKEDTPLAIQGSANTNSDGKDKNEVTETLSKTTKPSNGQISSPAGADSDTPAKGAKAIVKAGENETIKSTTDVSKAQNPKDANGNIRQRKIKKSFIRNFGFGLSLGPDVSGVKLSNTGKVTLTYGGLVSYSINDKFTLRSGFYVANKIYSADKDEYYASSGSTWNAYLQSVDAKCKVYEIPLTISYNFSKTRNHNLFASAGLSSYFMKRESYIYYYKNSADSTYNWPWTVQNKNKHYFSVLNISAGYEYSVNKRISITGEPYLKLPLSGIGAGKIKLNSAGVIFTVAIKPF